MFIIKPYKETKKVDDNKPVEKQVEQPPCKLFDNEKTPKTLMRILFTLWFTFSILAESMFLKFAMAYYQYCPHRLTASEAARLLTYSTISYSTFRLINVFLSMKLKINTIIKYNYIVIIIAVVILILAHFYYVALVMAGPVMMWGFAPMFAGTYSFTARYLSMTDQMSTLFLLGRGAFTLFTPSIIGEFIEHNSYVFIIVEITYIVLTLILFCLLNYMISKYKSILK